MPELPEVETVAIGLRGLLPGHTIQKISTDWPRSLRIDEKQLRTRVLGIPIIGVSRIGKMLLIHLQNQNSLILHLKLTGQLVYKKIENAKEVQRFGAGHPSKSLIAALPDKTTRVVFELDRGGTVYFNDMRKFGWIKICPLDSIAEIESVSKLGPDALEVNSKKFVQLLSKRKKTIKACLLDQTIIAGCGNIYADEALWLSSIHPAVPGCNLNHSQLRTLHQQLQHILRLSIEKGGSSIQNYVDSLGQEGAYGDFLKAYQRTGQPCFRCKTSLRRIVVASRGTHFCPKCQVLQWKIHDSDS